MNCEICFAALPEVGRDPILLRPTYGPCLKCSESHEQGWRDFIDDDSKETASE